MKRLGAYMYVINGVKHDMPFIESIQSVLPVVEEIHIVTDQRFNDGTIEKINGLNDQRIHLHIVDLDLENPALDGATKQLARQFCTAPFLVQMDCDEVFRTEDYFKINLLKENWPSKISIVGTGVIDWFNGDHVKLSAAGSVKERFTDGRLDIFHGIPVHLRIPEKENNGKYYYAQPESTDGAGLIDAVGNPLVPQLFFAQGDNPIKDIDTTNSIWIHHYSWYSLPRKWEMKQTWHYMWGRLFGRYKSLAEYKKDIDGEVVDFWGPSISKPHDVYFEPIADEMQDKSIVKAKNIQHPDIMKDWLSRQRVYIPPRCIDLSPFNKKIYFGKGKKINMNKTTFSFEKLSNESNN